MANERTTEDIVRDHLKSNAATDQVLEEQTSADPAIRKALAAASKSGAGGGKPEFILRDPAHPGLVIVVECKALRKHHESPKRDKPAAFAVDGVLHYMSHLSRFYDVIGVAVSGDRADDVLVSTFRQLRGSVAPEPLPSEDGVVDKLVPVPTYGRLLEFDPAVRARTQAELMAFSKTLHNYMRDHAKVAESEKPLVVSGILLALQDDVFKRNWPVYKPKDLGRELYQALAREVEAADLKQPKQRVMMAPYSFFETHPELTKTGRKGEEPPLRKLIQDIDEHVRPFIDTYHDVDVIGQFYGEFLRYTGGDKKGLGIVLTPRHLTQLFVRIANVGPRDTVVDTCAGTGGFLIAAMSQMDSYVPNDAKAQLGIRQHQLIGVEQQPHMFALAASNMILRGDGKANLYQGDCFDKEIQKALTKGVKKKHERPNIGLINPPFSQRGEGQHELDFAEALLDVLAPGGTAVIVAPMSCALEPHPARRRILEKHTLDAVMSLPNDLFHPVGVITCAMVLTAHQPHAGAPRPTWFGYWKDDGFVKTKDRGRIDLNNAWDKISEYWLDAYHNRRVVPGEGVSRKVTHEDEWCAEAYMETDYSSIAREDFEQTLREFAVFQMLRGG
ncbi:MAG: methylase [Thermoleophilia bacterium]|nr:methylase [Thermoleophilia bacterium]